jgi:hypothetical protein
MQSPLPAAPCALRGWPSLVPLLALGAALILCSPTARAALVERDLVPGSGDGLTTLDEAAGLEWLDLTVTLALRPREVLALPLVTDQNFRIASPPEVGGLLATAGITRSDGGADAENFGPAQLLLSLLGCTTGCGTNNPVARGIFQRGPDRFNLWEVVTFLGVTPRLGTSLVQPPATDFSAGIKNSTAGAWLVRDAQVVPEPSPLLLMGVGVAGLALARRRRSR